MHSGGMWPSVMCEWRVVAVGSCVCRSIPAHKRHERSGLQAMRTSHSHVRLAQPGAGGGVSIR